MTLQTPVSAALISLAVAGVSAPLVMKGLVAIKSRQIISQYIQEHEHKKGTPTMGGIIILIGFLAGCLAGFSQQVLPLLIIAGTFGLVGLADDYIVPKLIPGSRGLHWVPKLGLELGAVVGSCLLVGQTDPIRIAIFTFIVLFMSNAYNFSDGLDGLAGGLGMILCIGLVPLILVQPQVPLHLLVAIAALFAGFLPFLFYNAPPAKVFMGDVGALPIGAVLGWVMATLLLGSAGEGAINWSDLLGGGSIFWPLVILSFVMLVEIVPVPLQIASVKLRNKRLFNFKTPVHHAFQEKGWPETRIVWMFHLVQWACVVLSVGLLALGLGA
ncbi:MAG: hypothetical protein MUC92_12925 [Fimbriimonadaceae bacterium]|jgi:phospho-N-acetylmuramoyl-pentapeptide-transferase|nr:hypothetical protein [Fimbriimonadaceae bacterium]